MDKKQEDLVGRCLDLAISVLEMETTPTAATIEVVRELVGIVAMIEQINLRRDAQNRYGAAVGVGIRYCGTGKLHTSTKMIPHEAERSKTLCHTST